jgi:hypothetical protein
MRSAAPIRPSSHSGVGMRTIQEGLSVVIGTADARFGS